MAKFNLKQFSKQMEKEANKGFRKDLFDRLPDDLRKRFNDAGGDINVDGLSGKIKVQMDQHDQPLLDEVLSALDKK